jgi:hypothetical protein
LSEPKALAAVVREAEDPATRLLALKRIDDGATLQALALKLDHKATAVEAVERLDDPEALRAVAQKARVSAAARRARAKLEQGEPAGDRSSPAAALTEAYREERAAYERARAEHEQEVTERAAALTARLRLCESVEGAEGEAILPAVEQARAAWAALPALAGAEAEAATARFEGAISAAERRHQTFLAGLARRDELAALLAQVEELAAADEVPGGHSTWRSMQQKWKELAVSADQPDLRARYEEAARRLDARQRAARGEHEKRDRENLARLTDLAARAEPISPRGPSRCSAGSSPACVTPTTSHGRFGLPWSTPDTSPPVRTARRC